MDRTILENNFGGKSGEAEHTCTPWEPKFNARYIYKVTLSVSHYCNVNTHNTHDWVSRGCGASCCLWHNQCHGVLVFHPCFTSTTPDWSRTWFFFLKECRNWGKHWVCTLSAAQSLRKNKKQKISENSVGPRKWWSGKWSLLSQADSVGKRSRSE